MRYRVLMQRKTPGLRGKCKRSGLVKLTSCFRSMAAQTLMLVLSDRFYLQPCGVVVVRYIGISDILQRHRFILKKAIVVARCPRYLIVVRSPHWPCFNWFRLAAATFPRTRFLMIGNSLRR